MGVGDGPALLRSRAAAVGGNLRARVRLCVRVCVCVCVSAAVVCMRACARVWVRVFKSLRRGFDGAIPRRLRRLQTRMLSESTPPCSVRVLS